MAKHTVGFFSAYYRGLECLLKMWPAIRAEVPDAELNIYYGWGSWDALEGYGGQDLKRRIITLLHELKDQGVTEHGRVSHKALAKAMKQTVVWAYPTEFPEIHCITALKAQEAGCWPVVTNVAALNETVQSGDKLDVANIYSNEYAQQKFVKCVVKALKEGKRGTSVEGVDWADVATEWAEVMA
jgi:glycosyltransferase involved in cell wall biosynthesis